MAGRRPSLRALPVRALPRSFSRWSAASVAALLAVAPAVAEDAEVKALLEQNRQLVEQVRAQQKQIDDLRSRLDRLDAPEASHPLASAASSDRQVRVSGEVGIGFFKSGEDGAYPNSEFRVDDAKLFVEASVWKNVYFFGGLDLTTREANDEYFHVGELYVDIENLWSSGRTHTLSLRAGRMSLPFGEEYQVRNVMDNPLISHSLADVWGIDEGVQVYGTLGAIRYNVAVQNGGHKTLSDGDSDKSVILRLGYDPTPHLSFSASAMRTGKLSVAGDGMSEAWFANGFFRALGTSATTTSFEAKLAELDASYRWATGHFRAAVGWVSFDDNSTAGDYSRHLAYYSLEGTQRLAGKFFAAARYSAINAPGGYPLIGQGNAGEYFYNPFGPRTKDLQRLSLGVGYRFADPLVWKFEYSWEDGHLLNGAKRTDEDMLSSLLGIRF